MLLKEGFEIKTTELRNKIIRIEAKKVLSENKLVSIWINDNIWITTKVDAQVKGKKGLNYQLDDSEIKEIKKFIKSKILTIENI